MVEVGGIGKGGGATVPEEMDGTDMQWRKDKTASTVKVMEEHATSRARDAEHQKKRCV